MITKQLIQEKVQEGLKEIDAFLVDVEVSGKNKIFIEIDHMDGVPISTCVALSRFVENSLDRDDEDFQLEVASPGLDKPFRIIEQYHKNVGRSIGLLLTDGTAKEGKLLSVSEEAIKIEVKERRNVDGKKGKKTIIEELEFNFDQIKEAKTVISFK